MDVKCKAATCRVPTFALPRQAALGERILSSRPELSAQFPYGFFFFPESKRAGPKCRARRYQACIQISGTRATSFGGEKPALVHAINLGREGGGEKVMWSLLQSFLPLLHWYTDHTDRPFD